MFTFIHSLFVRKTRALNTINLSEKALLNNFSYLLSLHPWAAFFPVIKSNAYGHGIQQIATMLKHTSCTYICVDSYPEYKIASKCNDHQYLVLSDTNPHNYKLYNWKRTAFVVSSFSTLDYFIERWKKVRVHLFINTGMNREWFDSKDIPEIITLLKGSPHIVLEGIMSHLSHGDSSISSHTDNQIIRFKEIYQLLIDAWFSVQYRHIWASAGIFTIQDDFFNAWRAWIALYWYSPLLWDHPHQSDTHPLQPIATVQSTVLTIRDIAKWESVGYNGTWTADQATTIALIPFWYYEWLPRYLSNKRSVKRGNVFLPVVWNISMNYMTVATLGHPVQVWDTITLYGSDDNDINIPSNAAKLWNTNIYEVMIRRNEKIRRQKTN